MHRPELVAPAGSKEALMAAVNNGADAVYFGGTGFSARQYASNFSREELKWAVDYAHVRGVLAYVTVNTLVKDSELEEFFDYLQFLCTCGADAVIVQDLGVLGLLRDQLSDLPVHASTQMTVHNLEGVRFLQDMGVKRVVLPRELSLEDIRRILSHTGIEIETFIHGALCFSYSGQCLMSSMIGGRSGNRGYCAQPCRKKYRFNEAEGYLLSPRDLNLSERIGSLIDAGIHAFKIEGRMKRPEYVAGVVRVYRGIIDRYREDRADVEVTEEENRILLQLFNRGFTTGYFFGDPGSELMSRIYPHNQGTRLGTVIDYDRRNRRVAIKLAATLREGDGIGLGGRSTGFIARNMRSGAQRVATARAGSIVTLPLDREVKKNEAVFKTNDSQLMASLKADGSTKRIPVDISFTARIGEPMELRVSDGEHEITVTGAIASRAQENPTSQDSIARQLRKLGGTVFEARNIRFDLDHALFIPLSHLNALRRAGISSLEEKRKQKGKRKCDPIRWTVEKRALPPGPVLSVHTCSLEGLQAAVDGGAEVVYLGGEVCGPHELTPDECLDAMEYGQKRGGKIYLSTTRIVKNPAEFSPDVGPDGFLVADIGMLSHLHRITRSLIIDYPFNVFNSLSMDFLLRYGERVTLSPELTLAEIRNLAPLGPAECIVHGLFPLMVSKHDLAGSLFSGGSREGLLSDEKGFSFPVYTDHHHRTYLLNSRELCMLDHVPALMEAGVRGLRIEAKTYDSEAVEKITRRYREAIDGNHARKPGSKRGGYTTGHYFRGVV